MQVQMNDTLISSSCLPRQATQQNELAVSKSTPFSLEMPLTEDEKALDAKILEPLQKAKWSGDKPSVKELMEALSGKTLDEIDQDDEIDGPALFRKVSDMIYGVVGSKADTRDWSKIMNSDNIESAFAEETNAAFSPVVSIKSKRASSGEVAQQYPVIKDGGGRQIRALTGNVDNTKYNFDLFGITADSTSSLNLSDAAASKMNKSTFAFLEELKSKSQSL